MLPVQHALGANETYRRRADRPGHQKGSWRLIWMDQYRIELGWSRVTTALLK